MIEIFRENIRILLFLLIALFAILSASQGESPPKTVKVALIFDPDDIQDTKSFINDSISLLQTLNDIRSLLPTNQKVPLKSSGSSRYLRAQIARKQKLAEQRREEMRRFNFFEWLFQAITPNHTSHQNYFGTAIP